MYTVLIADDNPIICQALSKRIPWNELNLTLQGICYNGQEVMDKCNENVPDILITDIRMPIKDGLSVIEQFRTLYPNIQVIIISGYRDTSYLKKAIDEGVVNYLFKPIQTEELLNSLKKSIENINKQEHIQKISHSIEVFSHQEKRHALTKHLVSLLRGKNITPLAIMDQMFEEGSSYKWVLIPIPFKDISSINEKKIQEIYGQMEQLSQITQRVLICQPTPTLLAVLCPSQGVQLDEWLPQLDAYSGNKKLTHISSLSFSSSDEMDNVFLNILVEVFRVVFDNAFYHLPKQDEMLSSLSAEEQQTLRTHLSLSDAKGCLKWVEEKINSYLKGHPTPYGLDALIRSIIHLLAEQIKFFHHFYLEIEHIPLIPLGFQSTHHFTDLVWNKIWNELEFDNRIEEVLAYIEHHFTHELTIGMIADTFHYNTTYLGQLIKQKKGMRFNEYLNTLRINHAKDILARSSEIKVTDLAYHVGYTDHRYFSKVFKKMTGILPSEYGKIKY